MPALCPGCYSREKPTPFPRGPHTTLGDGPAREELLSAEKGNFCPTAAVKQCLQHPMWGLECGDGVGRQEWTRRLLEHAQSRDAASGTRASHPDVGPSVHGFPEINTQTPALQDTPHVPTHSSNTDRYGSTASPCHIFEGTAISSMGMVPNTPRGLLHLGTYPHARLSRQVPTSNPTNAPALEEPARIPKTMPTQ